MYTGLYINLDRCPDRRAEMESELLCYNLDGRYRRLAAADGNTLGVPNPRLNNGEIGCFISHYLALEESLGQDRHLHVVEDDTIFAACTEQVLGQIIESGEIDAFDILFTDVALPLSNDTYKSFKTLYDSIVTRDAVGNLKSAAFQIIGLDKIALTTTSSMLINRHAIAKIYQLYHDELTRGASLPIDAFLLEKAQAGIIKAGFIFPFVTSIRIEHTMHSTVRKIADVTMKFTAANIARYSFFVGCDWVRCRKLLDDLIPLPPPGDHHADILTHILAFSLIDAPAPANEATTKVA